MKAKSIIEKLVRKAYLNLKILKKKLTNLDLDKLNFKERNDENIPNINI